MKAKKFCKKCGLRAGNYDPVRYTCIECGTSNVKNYILEKTLSLYEKCAQCVSLVKGYVIRKTKDRTVIRYTCKECGKEWKTEWSRISLKDRLKEIGQK